LPTILITGSSPARLRAEARRIAAGLLCAGHADERTCGTCRRLAEGSHPDFLRVSPDGVAIKVDAVRDAIRFAAGRPYESAARVVWIESAEALREGAAAHALLKSLEEPGRFLTWILTTTAPDAILATVRSRCERRTLPRRTESEERASFARRGLDEAAVDDAMAFGLDPDDEIDLEAARELRRTALEALGAGGVSALLALAAAAADDDTAPAIVAGLLRDAAVLSSGGSADRLRHRRTASDLASVARQRSAAALRRAAVEVDALPERFSRAAQRRLAWEDALLELSE